MIKTQLLLPLRMEVVTELVTVPRLEAVTEFVKVPGSKTPLSFEVLRVVTKLMSTQLELEAVTPQTATMNILC